MVDILMGTYNGENYIQEQIESILTQDFKLWKLYIRDDGSSDNTINIIEYYANKYAEKIIFIKDEKGNLGAKSNFGELLKYSRSNYCMFCDQDDIWLSNKISISLQTIKEEEKKHGVKKPILVHTNLRVVDKHLKVIDDSYLHYMKANAQKNKINNLLVENPITGCTIIINIALKNLIKEIPKECYMHDWWISLIASIFGVIKFINMPTILYRQHGNNQVGAVQRSFMQKAKKNLADTNFMCAERQQAQALYDIYNKKLENKDKEIIIDFIKLKNVSFIKKINLVIKNKFFSERKLKNIAIVLKK